MADKIVSGSQGKWGTEIMPAHPDLSTYEAQLISEWILSASHDDSVDYLRGKEGTVKLEVPEHAGAGYFVMTAIYTDAGVQGKNKSSDVESIIIRLR